MNTDGNASRPGRHTLTKSQVKTGDYSARCGPVGTKP